MLGRLVLWVIMTIPVVALSQPTDRFTELLNSAPSAAPARATQSMDQFISRLESKRNKLNSDETFLRYLFREAHKTFLNHYQAYSQFPELFDSGKYDCLSATAFFSVVLDRFEFKYDIIETNYHIFLIVKAGEKQILFESTDRVNGFVSDEKVIEERLKGYEKNDLIVASSSDKYFYQYDLDLYQKVSPQQLTGLLYFNQAITSFNNKDLEGSALKLKKAIRIYSSPRIAEFAVILVTGIAESDLPEEEKKILIRPFAAIIKAKSSAVASR